MLKVELEGDRALVLRLEAMPASVQAALYSKTRELALNLQGYVKTQKLSGQMLRHVSGALSSSIKWEVNVADTSVYGRVFSSGDVKYAAFWEYGFHGTEQVSAHDRVTSTVFGRKTAEFTQHVSAHARKVDQPARSFLRSSMAENAAAISKGLKAAAIEGARKALGQSA